MNLEIPPQQGSKESNPNLALFKDLKGNTRETFLLGLSDAEVRQLFEDARPSNDYSDAERTRIEEAYRKLVDSSSLTLEGEGRADFGRARLDRMQDLRLEIIDIDEKIGQVARELASGDSTATGRLIELRGRRKDMSAELDELSNPLSGRDLTIFERNNADESLN